MFDGMVMLETKRAKHACKPNTVQFGGSCDLLIPPQSLDQQLIPARCDAHVFVHLLVRHGLVANLTIFALVFKASGATHELSSILEQSPALRHGHAHVDHVDYDSHLTQVFYSVGSKPS